MERIGVVNEQTSDGLKKAQQFLYDDLKKKTTEVLNRCLKTLGYNPYFKEVKIDRFDLSYTPGENPEVEMTVVIGTECKTIYLYQDKKVQITQSE